MSKPRYWVVVASRDHALHGVAQANHGKPGDGLVLYAPKLTQVHRCTPEKFKTIKVTKHGEEELGHLCLRKLTPKMKCFPTSLHLSAMDSLTANKRAAFLSERT